MVVAIMSECGMDIDDDILEAIVEKVIVFSNICFPLKFNPLSNPFFENQNFQTFQDADADKDDKISKEEWKEFVIRHPTLLKHLTLPYLQ